MRDTRRDDGAKRPIFARLSPAGAKTGSGFLLFPDFSVYGYVVVFCYYLARRYFFKL
jgi:hypothetical protein